MTMRAIFYMLLAIGVCATTASRAEEGPCQEHGLPEKVACLNVRLQKLDNDLKNVGQMLGNVTVRSQVGTPPGRCLGNHENVQTNMVDCGGGEATWKVVPR